MLRISVFYVDTRRLDLANGNIMFDSVGMKNKISEIRKARGLTLAEVAKRAGTSNQQVSHLEMGRRKLSYEWMERLAMALSCHPLDLLSDPPAGFRVDISCLSTREKDLLELFRTLDAQEQDTVLLALRPMVSFVTGSNLASAKS